MSIRRSQPSAPDSGQQLVRLLCLLLCGAAGVCGACASATVDNQPTKSGGAGGGAGAGGAGSGGSGGQGGKKDAGNRDVSFGSCNPFTNQGCSGSDKCAALQTGSELALGCGSKQDKGEGESCNQIMDQENRVQISDDCADRLSCFGATRICHRPCTETECCPADEICGAAAPGLPTLGWCQPIARCNPLEDGSCPDKQACYFMSSQCFTGSLCAIAGARKPGEACSLSNDCQPGSTCLFVGATGTCASFCSTEDGSTVKCTGAETGGDICDPLPGAESAQQGVGVCRKQP